MTDKISRCPVFPTPRQSRASAFLTFFIKRSSLLDGLYERSYRMKMGLVRLPAINFFIINQPEQVKQVMMDEVENFPKHPLQADILRPLLGDSIFTTNGEVWRRQRDMLDVAFNNRQVERVYGSMQDAVKRMLSRLEQQQKKGAFDIDREMSLVTADIIFRTILSSELETEKGMEILEAFERFQASSPKFALLTMFGIPARKFERILDRKRLKDAAIIRGAISEVIQERYQAYRETKEDSHQDILTQLFMARDSEGVAFTFEEIVDQVCMLFLAGHETSASALTWSIYLLALDADAQASVAQEAVHSLNGDSVPNLDTLKALKSTQQVFMEALRLYPPVGFFPRQAEKSGIIRDKQVKVGDCVVASPWLLHRHEELWENPSQFCPARFDTATSKGGSVPKHAYIPFGIGQRVCIGAAFARQEALLILSTIFANYAVSLAPSFEPKPVGRLTIRSENGLRVVLSPRMKV